MMAGWTPVRWSPPASSWIPESRVSTPESTSQGAVIALLFQVTWWLPAGVASQKSGPVAGDAPRFARQHTKTPRKEPRPQWVSPLDSGWTLHWTPEASGAASACALLSRAYSFSNGLVEMCKALRCTPENFLRGRFFLTADWRFNDELL